MRGLTMKRGLFVVPLCLFAMTAAFGAEVVSTMARAVPAVSNMGGISLTPVGTQPASYDDLAPVQLFEITKSANESISIGRMFTSCTCVRLESDKRTFGPGERAILRMRNVQATPPGGQSYALYVQLTSPTSITLRYDTFVQSAQFVPAPDGAPPTRGNIVADGVYSPTIDPAIGGGANIEVIIPKADIYVPDTSEYTTRKRAETEVAELASPEKDTAAGGVPSIDDKNTPQDKDAENAKGPTASPEMRKAVDAAIAMVERRLGSPAGVTESEDAVDVIAQMPANLSTDQAEQFRTEARAIARDVMTGEMKPPAQPEEKAEAPQTPPSPPARRESLLNAEAFAERALGEPKTSTAQADDDLWRKPAPRGRVRPMGQTAERVVPAETAANAVQSAAETIRTPIAPAASGTAASERSAARSFVDAMRTDESAIAERAREAAQAAGRTATETLQSGHSAVDAVGAR